MQRSLAVASYWKGIALSAVVVRTAREPRTWQPADPAFSEAHSQAE